MFATFDAAELAEPIQYDTQYGDRWVTAELDIGLSHF